MTDSDFEVAMDLVGVLLDHDGEDSGFHAWWVEIGMDRRIDILSAMADKVAEAR